MVCHQHSIKGGGGYNSVAYKTKKKQNNMLLSKECIIWNWQLILEVFESL